MLALFLNWTLAALFRVPRWAVARWRRARLGRRGVVRLVLAQDGPRPPDLAGVIADVDALREMAADPAVRAVELVIRTPRLGWASLQAIRRGLDGLRAAGKLVVAHLDRAGNQELYLASAADRVWMTPTGEAALVGVGARLVFFGAALDRFGVSVDLEAAGEYKSFGEPYTRSHPTPQNREAVSALVSDLHGQLVAGIARGRGFSRERVDDVVARSPIPAAEAAQAGLIDGALYPDQARSALEDLLDGEVQSVPFSSYARWARLERWLESAGGIRPAIAVVHLEGPVVHGAEPMGGTGRRIDADRVVPALDRLAREPTVRAVVLYVNSPGGGALASDLIARSVGRLASAKPVVAAFGDVAASGGYYLAARATEIVSEEGTLTGSIGVVGGKLVLGPALGRFGVTSEGVESGPNAGLFAPWVPFTPDQRRRFRGSLARIYDAFLGVVAGGRRMPIEAVDAIARGRVWTGVQAKERGLVDHLGGLDVALERAGSLAGLRPSAYIPLHIRFPAPRLRLLGALLGLGEAAGSARTRTDLVDLALAAVGDAGALGALVRAFPAQPLAVLPWVWDDE